MFSPQDWSNFRSNLFFFLFGSNDNNWILIISSISFVIYTYIHKKIYILVSACQGFCAKKTAITNTKNTPKNCRFHFDFSQRRNHPKMYLFLTCCTLEKYLAFHDGSRHFDSCVSVRCNEMYFFVRYE